MSTHWVCIGKEETNADKLRSVLAQLGFKLRVDKYVSEGIPFDKHLYWPEKHPLTNEFFLEREDEGHVLKVCFHHNVFML